jgi:hypothetical protein
VLVVPSEQAAALRAALAAGAPPAGRLGVGAGARISLFGHAVMEHVCFETAALSSAALVVGVDAPLPEGRALFERVDRALEARISDPEEFRSPMFDAVVGILPPDRFWVQTDGSHSDSGIPSPGDFRRSLERRVL